MKTFKKASVGFIALFISFEVSKAYAISPSLESIVTLANQSSCYQHSWKGRGVAPLGYIQGVTLTYARSLCRLKMQTPLSDILSSRATNNSAKDALTYYHEKFKKIKLSINESGVEPLRATYTLGVGLGMRESSGSFCEGWDRSDGSHRPSNSAESGVFQTSYNSINASPELSILYEEYKANPQHCLLDIFKQGVKCKSPNILGTGEGADFQKYNISCPAFATEYAMLMLRVSRKHYGPINRKEVQLIPQCADLLKQVQFLVESDLNICQQIMD